MLKGRENVGIYFNKKLLQLNKNNENSMKYWGAVILYYPGELAKITQEGNIINLKTTALT